MSEYLLTEHVVPIVAAWHDTIRPMKRSAVENVTVLTMSPANHPCAEDTEPLQEASYASWTA